ncbi:MAG: hypothetical protein RBR64_09285 [Bacteroidales bacterium]|jgi:hypothetical protein|nr:hypothetical protein [Bacteroidales bacterium]
MRALIIFIIGFFLVVFSSCGIKNPCELNHEGDISVRNYTELEVEVFVESNYAFTLSSGSSNSITKPVGTYNVRFIHLDQENVVSVVVEECEETKVNVSF